MLQHRKCRLNAATRRGILRDEHIQTNSHRLTKASFTLCVAFRNKVTCYVDTILQHVYLDIFTG